MPKLWSIFRRKTSRDGSVEGNDIPAGASEGKIALVSYFIYYVIKQPFVEINTYVSDLPDTVKNLWNGLWKPKIVFYILMGILFFEMWQFKDRTVEIILFSLVLFAFIYKEWVAGHWKHEFRNRKL